MRAERLPEELRIWPEMGFGPGDAEHLREMVAGSRPRRVLVDCSTMGALDDVALFALAEALRGPACPPVTFRGGTHHQARVFAYCMGLAKGS
jgi:hypothetical protein